MALWGYRCIECGEPRRQGLVSRADVDAMEPGRDSSPVCRGHPFCKALLEDLPLEMMP